MVPDEGWVEYLNHKWDRSSETEQRPHKVSFYIKKDKAQEVMKALGERLEKRGWRCGFRHIGTSFKLEDRTPLNTLVCGDSGNDAELFSIPDVYGVMVSNAQEELLQWHAEHAKDNPKVIHANERCAAGIIEAIGHFKLGINTSPRDVADIGDLNLENGNPGHEIVKFYLFYQRWRRAESHNYAAYIDNLKAAFVSFYSLSL
ncbi:putative sucrose-phosphatase 2 [Drosera capensis]